MKYLYPKQIIYLHKRLVSVFGGAHGLRDKGLLESAVYRPQASFGGKELYAGVFLKAAVLGHSIITNHPFLDGNKRTGFEAMRLLLRINGSDIKASEKKKFDFVLKIAKGHCKERDIADWLERHSLPFLTK